MYLIFEQKNQICKNLLLCRLIKEAHVHSQLVGEVADMKTSL